MDTTQFQQLPLFCFFVGGWRQQQTWQEHTDGDGCVWDGRLIDWWVLGSLAPNQTKFFLQARRRRIVIIIVVSDDGKCGGVCVMMGAACLPLVVHPCMRMWEPSPPHQVLLWSPYPLQQKAPRGCPVPKFQELPLPLPPCPCQEKKT